MKSWRGILTEDRGVTLIELLVVIALIAIVTAIASLNSDFIKTNRVSAATRTLLADLQTTRLDAMTKGTAANSRGYGIVFDSGSGYTLFEFNDVNTDYAYAGAGEQAGARSRTLSNGVTVTTQAGTSPAGDVLIYDRRGLVRNNTWATLATNRIYLLTMPGASQTKCIQIEATRIREGIWSGGACSVM